MSFEGYCQCICEKGHRFNTPYDYAGDASDCCPCGAQVALCNVVDDTNCDQYGVVTDDDWTPFLLTPERTQTCNLGHRHVVEAATYRVPTKDELRAAQSYWDGEKFVKLRNDK